MFRMNKNISVQVAIMITQSFTTKQKAAVMFVMVVLGSTSSELTLSVFDISRSIRL